MCKRKRDMCNGVSKNNVLFRQHNHQKHRKNGHLPEWISTKFKNHLQGRVFKRKLGSSAFLLAAKWAQDLWGKNFNRFPGLKEKEMSNECQIWTSLKHPKPQIVILGFLTTEWSRKHIFQTPSQTFIPVAMTDTHSPEEKGRFPIQVFTGQGSHPLVGVLPANSYELCSAMEKYHRAAFPTDHSEAALLLPGFPSLIPAWSVKASPSVQPS